MITTFDTLKYTKRAVQVGFTQEQAEFQAQQMNELVNDSFVTKEMHIEGLKHIDTKFDLLGSQLKEFIYHMAFAILSGFAALLAISHVMGW